MGAFTSKGTGARLKQKNTEMAARMKQEGVVRNVMLCPMCHRQITIGGLFKHLGNCK